MSARKVSRRASETARFSQLQGFQTAGTVTFHCSLNGRFSKLAIRCVLQEPGGPIDFQHHVAENASGSFGYLARENKLLPIEVLVYLFSDDARIAVDNKQSRPQNKKQQH
jgi:hypothetical protein